MANSKNVLTATDTNLESEVLKNAELTMVDFWAEWCGPCKALGPTIESIADQYEGRVKVYKLNVDENPDAAQRFKIRGIPTVIMLKGGQVIDQLVGNQPKDSFVSAIERNI
jgi:thioredoxin 1